MVNIEVQELRHIAANYPAWVSRFYGQVLGPGEYSVTRLDTP